MLYSEIRVLPGLVVQTLISLTSGWDNIEQQHVDWIAENNWKYVLNFDLENHKVPIHNKNK